MDSTPDQGGIAILGLVDAGSVDAFRIAFSELVSVNRYGSHCSAYVDV